MHFLKDLINDPQNDNPAKELPAVHRHFVKYSRGLFDGPIAKVRFTSAKINVNSSFEYEDLLEWVAAKSVSPDTIFNVSGNIICGSDFSSDMAELGLDWNVVKSTGKTKNYKVVLKEKKELTAEQMIKLIEVLHKKAYILLSFSDVNKKVSFSVKKNPPRPKQSGGKASLNDDLEKEQAARLKFASLKMNFSEESKNLLLSELIPDFLDELKSKTKQILVSNQYDIKELILPPRESVKSSKMIRYLTIRKGELIRTCDINGEKYSTKYDFKI
ncbi:MAG: hypothetical protein ACTSU2_00855 [Promethearchaeota archaeon]